MRCPHKHMLLPHSQEYRRRKQEQFIKHGPDLGLLYREVTWSQELHHQSVLVSMIIIPNQVHIMAGVLLVPEVCEE